MTAIIDDGKFDNLGMIAGWLVLPALGLIVAIVRDAIEAWALLRAFVAEPAIESLITIGIAITWLMFVCTVAAFFFRKHRWTPYLYIAPQWSRERWRG